MRQQASTSTRWSTSSTPRACARLSSSPWHLRCDVSLQAERSPGAELSSHAFSLLYVCSVGSRCRSTWSAAASSTGRTPWRCTATCTAPRQHASATSSPLRARPRRACMYSRVYVLPHSFRTLQQPLGPVEHAESHEQISPESRLKVHRKSNESSQKVHRSPHRWFSEAASLPGISTAGNAAAGRASPASTVLLLALPLLPGLATLVRARGLWLAP
jgi:hypothetical protein